MKGVVNIGEYKEWIPVTDELPKEKGLYMVSIDPRYLPPSDVALVDIWGWDGENWLVDNFVDGYDVVDQAEYPVIAWMPLPKPYLIWDEESQRCVKPIQNKSQHISCKNSKQNKK